MQIVVFWCCIYWGEGKVFCDGLNVLDLKILRIVLELEVYYFGEGVVMNFVYCEGVGNLEGIWLFKY